MVTNPLFAGLSLEGLLQEATNKQLTKATNGANQILFIDYYF